MLFGFSPLTRSPAKPICQYGSQKILAVDLSERRALLDTTFLCGTMGLMSTMTFDLATTSDTSETIYTLLSDFSYGLWMSVERSMRGGMKSGHISSTCV